jgi:hypothetical protein
VAGGGEMGRDNGFEFQAGMVGAEENSLGHGRTPRGAV